jgi:ribose transport system substrate-binding protein
VLFRRSPYLDELRRSHPEVPSFAVSPDQSAIGRIQGRQIRSLLPQGGQVLFVKGMPSSSSTQERFAATRKELEGSSCVIVGEVDGNWAEDVASREVDRWLRLMGPLRDKRIDVVACHNDSMARGAVAALRAVAAAASRPELARLPVIGADGLADVGRRLVDDGVLAATIVLPSPASPALDLLARALGQGQQPPPELQLDSTGYPDERTLAARARRPS